MNHRWRSLVALTLVFGLAVAGCSNGSSGSSSKNAGANGASVQPNALDAGNQDLGQKAKAVQDRSIVYTADLTVRVADAGAASLEATKIAEKAGGYLADQKADLDGQREATVTIRVPEERFRPALDQVAALGKALDRRIGSTDVTAEVVDVSGRLKSNQASAERLRALIAKAPSTGDIVTIEQELAKREAEIETLQGQLRVLDDRSTLATINVRFTEKTPALAPSENHSPGFVSAVKTGGRTLLAAGRVLVVVIGFLLPFLPLVALGWLGLRWWRRRRPASRGKADPGWTPPLPPPPTDG